MSTRTFKALIASGLLMLAGCELSDVLQQTGAGQTAPDDVVETAKLSNGVTVAAPDGYCVDAMSGKRTMLRQGIVFASCVRVKGSTDFDPTLGRLLTASTAGSGDGTPASLKAFLQTDEGKAALSAQGQATSIQIHKLRVTQHAVYVDLTDSTFPSHLGQRFWKGFLTVGNKRVLLGLYQGAGESVAGSEGEEAIRNFAASILRQNQPDT